MAKVIQKAIVFLVIIFGVNGVPVEGAPSDNGCVDCHQSLAPSPTRAHDFNEWKQSLHSRKGVTCEKCHGGNPSEPDSRKVHETIIKSNQPKSPLYYTQIPQTCGSCHAGELGEFKKSAHYKELQRSGKGPNCTLCHGSMAVRVPQPDQLEQSCTVCHPRREIVREALVELNLAGAALKKWEGEFEKASRRGGAPAAQEASLNEQREAFKQVQKHWHSFQMEAIAKESKRITGVAREALGTLNPQKGGE